MAMDETREKLIRAALIEFANHGVQAVTLASIRKAAGQANRSVIHYHFKDRDSLVTAVVDRVSASLKHYADEAVDTFHAGDFQQPSDLPALVDLMFMPFWRYYLEHPEGMMGMQFFSRMTWQTGSLGQSLLRDFFKPYFATFEEALGRTIPHLDKPSILLRTYMGVNTAIHGLADTGIIISDPDMAPLLMSDNAIEKIRGVLMGYLSGGIGAQA